jgi:hypothetical protein
MEVTPEKLRRLAITAQVHANTPKRTPEQIIQELRDRRTADLSNTAAKWDRRIEAAERKQNETPEESYARTVELFTSIGVPVQTMEDYLADRATEDLLMADTELMNAIYESQDHPERARRRVRWSHRT